MTFKILESNIIDWADKRNLLRRENSFIQLTKTIEEVGEVARALIKGNKNDLVDGIGDVLVTIIILAKQNGLDPTTCLEMAYNEIKDRSGETINGSFVKD